MEKVLPKRIALLRDELFAVESQTCHERAKNICKSYKHSEGEPMVIRRGKGISDVLRDMPIYIRKGELLVGSRSSHLGWRTIYPEYGIGKNSTVPREIQEYFKGKTIDELSTSLHTQAIRLADKERAACYVTGTGTGFGHVIVDYEKAITKGFRALIDEMKTKLKNPRDTQAENFLKAGIAACEGIIAWANRYAGLAQEQAESARGSRREELLEISRICRRVPEHPAQTLHEAMQSFVFVHMAMHIEQNGWSISAGRFDQYMYPFYKRDIEAGRLTRDSAMELVLSMWIKFMENINETVKITTYQNLTLGGQLKDGSDASNEFSHMCLDASMLTGFNQPALSVRWHRNIDRDFWRHCMEVIAGGIGMPALFNDEVIYKALEYNGISREDMWNYGIVGCVEASIPGKMQGMTSGGHLNMAKALELALNDGVSQTSGLRIGLPTGDAGKFESFEELKKAYETQSKYLMAVNIEAANIAGNVQKQLGHCPLMSCLLDDCIAQGRDMVDGGTHYSLSGISVFGSPNAADGMTALKKLVFERKLYTMQQVTEALKQNFEGFEDMRQMFINQDFRFGNDVPEADEMANELCKVHADFAAIHPDMRGGHFTCGVWPVNGHVETGENTGALPDGRLRGEPVADGVGACQGRDINGPTALLKSVAGLNNIEHWAAGNTCNIKFSKSSIFAPGGLSKMENLAEVFMDLGGQELQINVVDAETLKDAQENPEKYSDLIVRVAGYSAYFTMLDRRVQDEVISRTQQSA